MASWFWARKRLAIAHFPRTGCKVVAGVNNPLHRNQGPGEPGEAPNALLALNLDQKQQERGKVTVSFSSLPGGTDEIHISSVPGGWGGGEEAKSEVMEPTLIVLLFCVF